MELTCFEPPCSPHISKGLDIRINHSDGRATTVISQNGRIHLILEEGRASPNRALR